MSKKLVHLQNREPVILRNKNAHTQLKAKQEQYRNKGKEPNERGTDSRSKVERDNESTKVETVSMSLKANYKARNAKNLTQKQLANWCR